MKQLRLESLADGIFAIVMTLLVIEIRVPELIVPVANNSLFTALQDLTPLFLSYLLSFALLFTYWRSHHFIASIYAKNIDVTFTNINAVFFFFVGLVPFTSHLLGRYSHLSFAVILFALNVICIGLSLLFMRLYITRAKTIENESVSQEDHLHAYARILFPVICAFVAILVSIINTQISLVLLTLGILFNLASSSTRIVFGFVDLFFKKKSIFERF